MKILVGAPVHQKPSILKAFLTGLECAEKDDVEVEYLFVDDNSVQESSALLDEFGRKNKCTIIQGSALYNISAGLPTEEVYNCDAKTHLWSTGAIKKIAAFKDYIIAKCIEGKYDYLFLIDSDIVLDRRSFKQLLKRNVDIISNVFWTQWLPNGELKPQCFWIPNPLSDDAVPFLSGGSNNAEQIIKDKMAQLRVPGMYRVDGLGACTLISRKALCNGARFEKIPNLSIMGEDRDFCIRAAVQGFTLFMETTYPAYHIYREEYLNRVEEFMRGGFKFDMCQSYVQDKKIAFGEKLKSIIRRSSARLKYDLQMVYHNFEGRISKNICEHVANDRIVLQMIVRNECGRYLEDALKSTFGFVDYYVIMDDASTDGTPDLCEDLLNEHPHTIIRNKKSLFSQEYKLRTLLWKETVVHNPGWVLSLDADEVLTEGAGDAIKQLIGIKHIDLFKFRLFDMWNEKQYRDDDLWCAHKKYFPFLMRYKSNVKYHWQKTNQHCGRFPKEWSTLSYVDFDIRIKHFGWAREEDREKKYKRYLQLDPDGKLGNMQQYNSIMDAHPALKDFCEESKSI